MTEKDIPTSLNNLSDGVMDAVKEARKQGLSDYEGIFGATVRVATEIEWHTLLIINLLDLLEKKAVVTPEERAELRAKTDKTLHDMARELGQENTEK
jgi:hypothetical protein